MWFLIKTFYNLIINYYITKRISSFPNTIFFFIIPSNPYCFNRLVISSVESGVGYAHFQPTISPLGCFREFSWCLWQYVLWHLLGIFDFFEELFVLDVVLRMSEVPDYPPPTCKSTKLMA